MAHVRHEGNKEADRLAKLGTLNSDKHMQVGTPQAEIKSDISKYVRRLWDEEWQTYTEGKHTKEFYAHNGKSTTFFFLFSSGVPQRLDAGDLGRPTRYCYLESIYHTWEGGTNHRAFPSVPSHSVHSRPVLGGLH